MRFRFLNSRAALIGVSGVGLVAKSATHVKWSQALAFVQKSNRNHPKIIQKSLDLDRVVQVKTQLSIVPQSILEGGHENDIENPSRNCTLPFRRNLCLRQPDRRS